VYNVYELASHANAHAWLATQYENLALNASLNEGDVSTQCLQAKMKRIEAQMATLNCDPSILPSQTNAPAPVLNAHDSTTPPGVSGCEEARVSGFGARFGSGDEEARVSGFRPRSSCRGVTPIASRPAPSPL
jgi:hypothetical protein